MIGFDPLTASTLLILAGQTLSCPKHAPTKINVIPRTEKVTYDSSQSLKQLQTYNTDTVDPYAFHGQTITRAFMKGKIGLEQKVRLGQSTFMRGNAACVWYDTITVEIHIEPQIVIAKEIYNDSCLRKAVLGHELKHVRVDREIVNKYAKSIGKKLMKELKTRGFEAGPFDPMRTEEVGNKMQRVVSQILELEYRKLGIERQELQRDVDSLKEYESVDDKCPLSEKKMDQLYADMFK